MGGSGGGFFRGRLDPDKLRDQTRQAEASARDDQFETEVAAFLGNELARYNDRDTPGVNDILDKVKNQLADEIEGTVDLVFGGSVAKHTYVDGLSDVDALLLMSRADIAGKQPGAVLRLLAKELAARFGRDCVDVGRMAVTLNLANKSIQLLPAVKEGKSFRIPRADGKEWSKINPRTFAQALTKANKDTNGKLIPTIKLAKAIIASLPEQRRLTGYHTEALALRIFQKYKGPITPKAMVRHFFEKAPDHVRQAIRDKTGQSHHVDAYLGKANSIERRIVADALDRISRKMKNADGARSVPRWREIIGSA